MELREKLAKLQEELKQKDQILIQQSQELKQKDQILIQQSQELIQQSQELIQQSQELKRKDQELKQKDQELNETKMAYYLSNCISQSHRQVYHEFSKYAVSHNSINFKVATTISEFDSKVGDLWKKLVSRKAPDVTSEAEIQRWFDKAIPEILVGFGNNNVSYVSEQTMTDPVRVPDAILVPKDSIASKWSNVVLAFEYESSTAEKANEGRGQAISYGAIAMKDQSVPRREMIISIFSNWTQIALLQIDGSSFHETALLTLFPVPVDDSKDAISSSRRSSSRLAKRPCTTNRNIINSRIGPSSGFIHLCKILCSSPRELGFLGPPKTIRVNKGEWQVLEVLGHGADSAVYMCKFKNEKVAVKVPIHPSSSTFHELQLEAGWIQTIRSALPASKAHLLPEVVFYCFNALVMKPIAPSLTSKLAVAPKVEIQFWLIRWLNGLRDLHTANYCHNDMRPANVLVDMANNDVLFIDWQSATKIGNIMASLRSSIPQIPSRWIPFVLGKDCDQLIADPRDDIEQWIYAVSFFLNDQRFPWMLEVKKSLLSFNHENEVYESVHQNREAYYRNRAGKLEKTLYNSFMAASTSRKTRASNHTFEYDGYVKIMNSLK